MKITNQPKIQLKHHRNSQVRLTMAIAFLTLTLILSGCSKFAGSASMTVKSPAGAKEMPVKSSYAFAVTKTFTDINQKITTAPSYSVYAANYDLDAANFGQTLNKQMASDDQMRVTFSLVGEEGGNEKTQLKAGDYSAKADKFMKVETVGIVTRKDGKDITLWLDRSSTSGNVKVTSVTADKISGEADVTAGDNSIKGPFTATVLVRK